MGWLIILEQFIEEEGPVVEEELAAEGEAIATEAETLGKETETAAKAVEAEAEDLAREAEAEGKTILDKIEKALGDGQVDEVCAKCTEMEPGVWDTENESMSEMAQEYQSQVTGAEPGQVYRVEDVKFDGYSNGTLLEAKGPGYAKFVQADGTFKPWFQGASNMLDQAERQLAVAKGMPIEWHVAEQPAAEAITNLFAENGITGIKVIWTPMIP